MPKTLLVFLLAAALASSGASLTAQASDAELEAGIRLAQEGEFEQAVLALDRVVQRLAARRDRSRDRARALVYLSIAHLGLDRRAAARERFLEALSADPKLELSGREFPPTVLEFFDEVRGEMPPQPQPSAASPAPARPSPTPQPAATTAPAKEGRSKAGMVLLGLGAAGAAVAVAAGGGTPAPMTAPTPQPTPTPDPRTVITPTRTIGRVRITLSSITPAPGSTISGCGPDLNGCAGRLAINFTLIPGTVQGAFQFTARTLDPTPTVCLWSGFLPLSLRANETASISVALIPASTCRTPVTMTLLRASVWEDGSETSVQDWTFTYGFSP